MPLYRIGADWRLDRTRDHTAHVRIRNESGESLPLMVCVGWPGISGCSGWREVPAGGEETFDCTLTSGMLENEAGTHDLELYVTAKVDGYVDCIDWRKIGTVEVA